MRTIKTYDDLLAEKEELTAHLATQKAFIKQDILMLKEELKPATNVVSLLGKMVRKDKTNPAIALGVDIVGDLLIKNTLLRRGGWLTRLVIPFIAKNLSSHLLNGRHNGHAKGFFQRLLT
jgi:hypothetical protein